MPQTKKIDIALLVLLAIVAILLINGTQTITPTGEMAKITGKATTTTPGVSHTASEITTGTMQGDLGVAGNLIVSYPPQPAIYNLEVAPTYMGLSGKVGYAFTTNSSAGGTNTPLFLDNAGNVGIGTTNPVSLLAVGGTSPDSYYKLYVAGDVLSSNGYAITGGSSFTSSGIYTAANDMLFKTYASGVQTRMTILANNGNVGIGTPNPGAKLDVAGQIKITGGAPGAGKVLTSDAAGLASWQTVAGGIGGSGTASYAPLWTSSTTLGNSAIYQSGNNIGIGTTSPGAKLDVVGGGIKTSEGVSATSASVTGTVTSGSLITGSASVTNALTAGSVTASSATVTGTATVSGQKVCLADGTNCPKLSCTTVPTYNNNPIGGIGIYVGCTVGYSLTGGGGQCVGSQIAASDPYGTNMWRIVCATDAVTAAYAYAICCKIV